MKKQDLMNGDIVIDRTGLAAVVIAYDSGRTLLYEEGGYENLEDMYDEDLCHVDEGEAWAIMQVYRPEGATGFETFEEDMPIYERDEEWIPPTKKERAEAAKAGREMQKAEHEKRMQECREKSKDLIFVIAQAFYGNRTGTEVKKENIDQFILGRLSEKCFSDDGLDRTVIRLPGSENTVLVYNKYQEKEALEDRDKALENGYEMKPLAVVPELKLELYSRCILCRMNENGEFMSVEKEDKPLVERYLLCE